MTREIKFRAWWKHSEYLPDGQMYKVGGVSFVIPQEGEPESDYLGKPTRVGLMSYDSDKIGWNNSDECILMQYTGLKDKNGVEIYEGDIVSKGLEKYHIEFYEGMFCIQTRHYGIKPLQGFIGLEVIGNIYQNPELLK